MAKTILLADDSVTIQKVVELTFMDEDYQIVAVSDGNAALAKLEEGIPDLVIADVHMPGADGYEVCRTVKQRAPEVPVVLLVGTFEPFDADQAASVSSDGHLKKPFDSQDLLQLVDKLIGGEAAVEPVTEKLELPSPALAAADSAAEVGSEDATLIGSSTDFGLEDGAGTPRIQALVDEEPATPFADSAAAVASEATPVVDDLWDGSQSVTEVAGEAIEDASEAAVDAAESVVSAADDLDLEAADVADSAAELLVSAEEEAEAVELADSAPEADTRPTSARSMDPSEAASEIATESVASDNGQLTLSASDLERVAKRVVELISDKVLHDVAWEVIPDLAELAIKERIRDLESQVE